MGRQMETWTILRVLEWTREFLAGKGVENARLEAEWMLCAVCGLDRVGLYLNYDRPLNAEELAGYRGMIARRGRREPLQHILGSQEFMGLEFEVAPEVLIPRHDTEVLVTEALRRAPGAGSILDIGTGSGCIAVALASSLPRAAVCAVDISPEALAVARRNADRHAVAVEFCQGSLFDGVAGRRFDLIVSNPPYIPTADIEGLEPEVRDHDPRLALDGGPDGLAIYRHMVPAARSHLTPGGWLMVEVGIGQADAVQEMFRASGYRELFVARDPGEVERVVGGMEGGRV